MHRYEYSYRSTASLRYAFPSYYSFGAMAVIWGHFFGRRRNLRCIQKNRNVNELLPDESLRWRSKKNSSIFWSTIQLEQDVLFHVVPIRSMPLHCTTVPSAKLLTKGSVRWIYYSSSLSANVSTMDRLCCLKSDGWKTGRGKKKLPAQFLPDFVKEPWVSMVHFNPLQFLW